MNSLNKFLENIEKKAQEEINQIKPFEDKDWFNKLQKFSYIKSYIESIRENQKEIKNLEKENQDLMKKILE